MAKKTPIGKTGKKARSFAEEIMEKHLEPEEIEEMKAKEKEAAKAAEKEAKAKEKAKEAMLKEEKEGGPISKEQFEKLKGKAIEIIKESLKGVEAKLKAEGFEIEEINEYGMKARNTKDLIDISVTLSDSGNAGMNRTNDLIDLARGEKKPEFTVGMYGMEKKATEEDAYSFTGAAILWEDAGISPEKIMELLDDLDSYKKRLERMVEEKKERIEREEPLAEGNWIFFHGKEDMREDQAEFLDALAKKIVGIEYDVELLDDWERRQKEEKIAIDLFDCADRDRDGFIIRLNLKGKGLVSLPELPEKLAVLDCSDNVLEKLPTLPDTLTKLNCANNYLTELPNIPKKLYSLNCSGNKLTKEAIKMIESKPGLHDVQF